MVVTFNEGQVGTARSLLAMISSSLLIQLWLVYVQTSGGPRRLTVKYRVERNETGCRRDARGLLNWSDTALIVLSGTKPGVDAMRVGS